MLTLSELGTALLLAGVAGLHVSTWGAYKDAPYEGYHPLRQLRTLALAGVGALVVVGLGLGGPSSVLPTLGVVYTFERLVTEWWKTILRRDDQSAYAIPMRLGFRGRPVDTAWKRYGVGAVVIAGFLLITVAVKELQDALPAQPTWLVAVTVGALGGWLTAAGGAWKDAPVEGFSGWKFLRSPAVATAWALPLSVFTSSWVVLCLGAGGMAVASIETYKTFFTGGRAPGKFEGKRIRWSSPELHRALGVGHAFSWLSLGLLAVIQGRMVTGTVPVAVSTALFALAVVAAILVLRSNGGLVRAGPSPAPGPGGKPALVADEAA